MIRLRASAFVFAGIVGLGAIVSAYAQSPAGRPFAALFHFYWYGAAFGIQQDLIAVNGAIITVPFDYGCAFICPATRAYVGYPFQMPALAQRTYQVDVVDGANPSTIIARFPLAVGAVETSATNIVSLSALALTLVALSFAGLVSHKRRSHSRPHRGSHA